MAHVLIILFLGPMVAILLLRTLRLTRNYLEARKLGLPIILLPVSWQDPLWLVFRDSFTWVRRLPFGIGTWEKYSVIGWTFLDPYETHDRLGDALVLVSPGKNEIVVADPEVGAEIMSKYRTWHKPTDLYRPFRIFGPSVASTNAEDWQRHRKITGPAFREQNVKMVWVEALRQADQMCKAIDKAPNRTLEDVHEVLMTAVLHVLSAATTGHSYDYEKGLTEIPPGHQHSYAEMMGYSTRGVLKMMLLKDLQLPAWSRRGVLKEVYENSREIMQYMKETVDQHLSDLHAGNVNTADLVGALVAANEEERAGREKSTTRPMHLTTEELYGNLYVFNLAGFETTTNALSYAVPYLAANPQTQEWVAAEVMSNFVPKQSQNFEDIFPRLVRCMAVMYETLRLDGAVVNLARHNTEQALTLHMKTRDVDVPPSTLVTVNFTFLHTSPKYWGSDSLEWRPERWIEIDGKTGAESLKPTPEGAMYMPWSIGPRVCPGKKFSQAEFVAIIATILSKYRLKPRIMHGEDETAALANLGAVIADSIVKIFPVIKRPKDAGVDFQARQN